MFSLLGLVCCIKERQPCPAKQPDSISGIVVRVLDDKYIAYEQSIGDLGSNGIKLSSESNYKNVFAYCCQGDLDTIDFDKYDVLGLSTVNRGSNSSYVLDVKKDDGAKKVIYTVTENYCQTASPFDGRGNFVVIPKIPSGYTVEYVRN